MDTVFQALSSAVRRRILAYLSKSSLTAGEIADRFDMRPLKLESVEIGKRQATSK